MYISQIAIDIITFFIFLGGVDYLLGNPLGFGGQFRQGILFMGVLMMSLTGVLSLSPVLTHLMQPLIKPIHNMIGADPSFLNPYFFIEEAGAYDRAMQVAKNSKSTGFIALIVESMLGSTLLLTIPLALGFIDKRDYQAFSFGILVGLVTIPVGSFISGLIAGYHLSFLVIHLLPVVLLSLLILAGLIRFPLPVVGIFLFFCRILHGIIILGFLAILIQSLTGIILIPGLLPLNESLATLGHLTVILAGVFPLFYGLKIILRRPFQWLGRFIALDNMSLLGLIASPLSSIPTFMFFSDMSNRGKIVNAAFMVSASFILCDYLGFDTPLDKPVLIGKLLGGFAAIVLASLLATRAIRRGIFA